MPPVMLAHDAVPTASNGRWKFPKHQGFHRESPSLRRAGKNLYEILRKQLIESGEW